MKPLLLWSKWPAVLARIASARQVALFLDYDGTLVPIASHPARARLPESIRALLRRLAATPGVAVHIVSGRSLHSVRQMVRLEGITYVGNHGLELRDPLLRHVNPRAVAYRRVMHELAPALRRALAPIRGAWVENKGLTLSVHYRLVAAERLTAVKAAVDRTVRRYLERGLVRMTAGRRVLEIRPPVRWTKGTMVNWLLARLAARGGTVLPIYIGDDMTDEDAFIALRGRGVTIAVAPVTMATQARYYVRSPRDVHRFLRATLNAHAARA